MNGTIVDTLTGNLLDAGNTAVVSSDCTAALPDRCPGTCTIVTRRTVLATDPDPLCNTVTVHYNPHGFPNDITDTATACVDVKRPVADITITKTADELSKVGDAVTYTFEDLQHRRHHGDPWLASSTRCSATSRRPSRPRWRRGQCVEVADAHGGSRRPRPAHEHRDRHLHRRSGTRRRHGEGQCQHEPVPARRRRHQELHA